MYGCVWVSTLLGCTINSRADDVVVDRELLCCKKEARQISEVI